MIVVDDGQVLFVDAWQSWDKPLFEVDLNLQMSNIRLFRISAS
mgnify:CR=1 FL=1